MKLLKLLPALYKKVKVDLRCQQSNSNDQKIITRIFVTTNNLKQSFNVCYRHFIGIRGFDSAFQIK